MYQNLREGDIVLYCPEFYAEGSKHDQLYELVEIIGHSATIRRTNDPNVQKTVPISDLELSFSMSDPDEGMPW